MTNVFTLDSLRAEADEEFAPVTIPLGDGTDVTLRNIMRLNKETREEITSKVANLGGEGVGIDKMLDAANEVLLIVADRGPELLEAIDGDLPVTMKVLSAWMEGTQLGEAESSPAS